MDFLEVIFGDRDRPKVVEIKEECEYLFERLKNKYEELIELVMRTKNDEHCCVIEMPA